MAPQNQNIKSGDDVTRLMNLKSGDDVTDLMNTSASPDESIGTKIYNAFAHPFEPNISIPRATGEGQSKGLHPLGRLGNWVAEKIIEPSTSVAGIATLPLASFRLGRLGLGAAGAAYGAYNAPSDIGKVINNPSLENVADAALDLSMIVPGAKMAKGMIPRRKLGGTVGKEVIPPVAEDLPLNPVDPEQPFKTKEGLDFERASEDAHMKDMITAAGERRKQQVPTEHARRATDNPSPVQFEGSAPRPKYRLHVDGSYELIAPTAPVENSDLQLIRKKGKLSLEDLNNDPEKIANYAKYLRGEQTIEQPISPNQWTDEEIANRINIAEHNIMDSSDTHEAESIINNLDDKFGPPRLPMKNVSPTTLSTEVPLNKPGESNISTSVKQRAAHVKRILKANDEARAADPSISKLTLEQAQAQAQKETTAGLEAMRKANNPPPNKPPKSPLDMGELPDYSIPETPLEKGTSNPGLLGQINNFAKTALTSYDISAPGRQALPLWHTKAFWTSWDDMFRAWGSERAYNNIMQGIADRELFRGRLDPNGRGVSSIAEKAGLDLTDILSNREERFGSKLAERIPVLGRGVKASERAYTAFLNKVRADHFETLYNAAKAAGRDPDKDLTLAKGIADFINTATGRGSLGKLEAHAKLLNDHLFAPRFYASRIKMLNPLWYADQDPFVRKEALKSLFALTSLSTGVSTLSEMAGLDVSRDRTSSDYGKIKIGNTRLDPYAGFQQYEVLANRLVQGTYDMYVNGNVEDYGKFGQTTPLDAASNFVIGKLNPVQSFVAAMMRGKDFDNKPFEFLKGLEERVVPIMVQDIYDILQDDPSLLWLAAPASIGMGVQTYGR